MTGAEVISDVRQSLLEPVAGFWTDAELLRWVNLAEQDYFNKIRGLEGKTTASSTAGINEYALPSNWVSAVAVFYNKVVDGVDNWSALEPTDLQELADQDPNFLSSATNTRGTPTRYFLWNRAMYLYPTPDESGSGNILMFFKAKPTQLTTTASSINLDDSLSGAIRAYVLWHAWEKEKELGLAEEQKNLYFQFVGEGRRWQKLQSLNKNNDINIRTRRDFTW